MAVLGIIWLVSIFASWFVYYSRSGLAAIKSSHGIDWREFGLANVGFFLLMWVKMLTWPLVLVVWLVTGMKPSPWVATVQVGNSEVRKVLRRQRAIELGVIGK